MVVFEYTWDRVLIRTSSSKISPEASDKSFKIFPSSSAHASQHALGCKQNNHEPVRSFCILAVDRMSSWNGRQNWRFIQQKNVEHAWRSVSSSGRSWWGSGASMIKTHDNAWLRVQWRLSEIWELAFSTVTHSSWSRRPSGVIVKFITETRLQISGV